MNAKRLHLVRVVSFLFVLFITLTGCNTTSKPTVVILSPASGSEFQDGETVAIQSTSTDSSAIVRIELIVDNIVVRTDAAPTPQGQPSLTLIQTWKATQGNHTIVVRAYNAAGAMSDPVAVAVLVQANIASSAPTAVPTVPLAVLPVATLTTIPSPVPPQPTTASSSSASSTCTNDAAFVADVTVPDGTNFAVGQTFNKIWRLSNSGSCTWGVGYQLVFASGTAMTGSTVVSVPATAPGATADILVPMTAPASNGSYTGVWRMRAGGSTFFGKSVTVKIVAVGGATSSSSSSSSASSVASSSASGCSGQPNIASFTGSAPSVAAAANITVASGTAVTLSWGEVTNADSLEIDNGIGGQASPGSTIVTPGSTTTYTLTAHCGGSTKTAQVQVNVTSSAMTVVRCSIQSESGEVVKSGGSRVATQALIVGDDSSHNSYRTFLSFDIHDIAGKTIDVGNLNIGGTNTEGNPFNLGGTMFVGVLDYGTLDGTDYDLAGTAIVNITSGPNGQYNIKPTVQSAVSASKNRLQLRLHMSMETNSNSVTERFSWNNNNLCVTITYH